MLLMIDLSYCNKAEVLDKRNQYKNDTALPITNVWMVMFYLFIFLTSSKTNGKQVTFLIQQEENLKVSVTIKPFHFH